MFEQELKHLHIALELLRQYEKKDWQEVIPDAESVSYTHLDVYKRQVY